MLGRADVPPEHLDPSDRCDRSEVAGEVLVAEDHLLDGEAQPEGDDGEVHAPGAERGDGEDQARRGSRRPHRRGTRAPPASPPRHEPGREERAESADRVLGERQLTGVPGQHDDRQDEHPDDQRRVHRGRPLGVERERVEQRSAPPRRRRGTSGSRRRCRGRGAARGRGCAAAAPCRGPRARRRSRGTATPAGDRWRRSRSRTCRAGTC